MARLVVAAPLAVFLIVGLLMGSARDGAAYYGDPRFAGGQAPSRLLHNVPGDEFIVTSQGSATVIHHSMATQAITAWNNALMGPPNSISKYALHYNGVADPAANVIIEFVAANQIATYCTIDGRVAPACNDGQFPITRIYVDKTQATIQLITHELGHSLQFTDQYYSSGLCSPATTVMDCESIQEDTDENDFRNRYRPQSQSANPTYPETAAATWTVFYGGEVKLWAPPREVEYKYFWRRYADTNGSLTNEYETAANDEDLLFGYVVGSRYCVDSRIYNEVGYAALPGGALSPRSQFSCIGAAQSQNAGFLLGTSDRNNPSTNNLYLRVKNFSGGTRNVAIFGPNFANIGCGYANLANNGTRQCSISLARGAYSQLTWFAFDTSNNVSWGYLDFE